MEEIMVTIDYSWKFDGDIISLTCPLYEALFKFHNVVELGAQYVCMWTFVNL